MAAALQSVHELRAVEPLLIIPEYKVPSPGGRRESQTDVFILGRMPEGLVTIAVEGKAEEAFGPTVAERRSERSVGIEELLRAIYECIGVSDVPNTIRYQLLDPLHRLGPLPSSRQAMG